MDVGDFNINEWCRSDRCKRDEQIAELSLDTMATIFALKSGIRCWIIARVSTHNDNEILGLPLLQRLRLLLLLLLLMMMMLMMLMMLMMMVMIPNAMHWPIGSINADGCK